METIKLGKKEVILDDNILRFDEHTLNEFFKTFAARYNEFHQYFADAQYLLSSYEDRYESIYSEKFQYYKTEKVSDKLSEAKTKADQIVQEAAEHVRISKRNVTLLNGFLKSMDKAHDDAKEISYILRKEMDKLYPYIKDIQ